MNKFIAALLFSTIAGSAMGSPHSAKLVSGIPRSYENLLSRNTLLVKSIPNLGTNLTGSKFLDGCVAPEGINVTNIGFNSVRINWSLVSTALGYQVRYKKVGESEWMQTGLSSNGIMNLFNLTADSDYEVQVASVCRGNVREFSASVNFKTISLADCKAPEGINVTNIGVNSARINWSLVSAAMGYKVRYRKVGESVWKQPNSSYSGLSLSNLTVNSNYEVQIASICDGSIGEFSASVNFKTTSLTGCAVPEGINATNISLNSARINWSLVNAAMGYKVRYRKAGESAWQQTNSYSSGISLYNLSTDTDYEVQVASLCNGSVGEFSNSINFKTISLEGCAAPEGINATNIGVNSARINWSLVSTALGYQVRYRKAGESAWQQTSSSSNGINLSNLTADSDYEVQVASLCNGSVGEFSNSINFKTISLEGCAAPEGINATNISLNSARINWSLVSTALGYQVRYRKTGESVWQQTSSSSNGINLSNLTVDSDYEVQVASLCNGSVGEFSNSINFKTISLEGCVAPEGINATNIGVNSARISWSEVNISQGYQVRYRKAGESAWQQTYISSIGLNLSNLTADTDYEVQVASVCSGSVGVFSDSVNFKTISFAECGIPKAINATNISLNSAQITWSLISTAEGYHVSYRKIGESDWKQVFVSSNEVNLINLTADTDYEVQVASSCSGTIGEFSDAINFKTKSLGVCGVPKRVTVYHIGANTASATWANVSGASSYNINYRMIGSGAQSNWSNVTAYTNSIVLSGLAADKEYEVRISTVCDEISSSDYTTPVGFKTLLVGTGCQSPEAININTITSTTANVNWEAVAASTGGYVLLYKRTAANTWWEDMATSSNNAALSGLRPGTDYQVKIASICDGRLGEFSNPVDFSTLNNIDSVTANHAKEIKLYPNPAIDILNVNNISDNAIYKIYNSTGKMINSGNITQNKINVSQLSQGIYIIMIEQGKDIFRSQFIKK